MSPSSRLATLAVLLCALVAAALAPEAARAQEPEAQPERLFPGPFQTASRLRALNAAAEQAEADVAAARLVEDLEVELDAERRRLTELRGLIATVSEAEYMRPERITRVRDQALQEAQRLGVLRDRALQQIEALDALQTRWNEEREFWQAWRASLRGDPRLPAVDADFRRALARIDAVLAGIDEALPALLALHGEVQTLGAEAEQSAELVATIRQNRRRALTQRGEPVLLSPAHTEQLAPAWQAWEPLAIVGAGDHRAFLQQRVPLLLVHLLLVLGLAWLALRLRRRTIPERAWSGLLLRPRATAVFAATALLAGRYVLAPPLWDVLMWALLAGSGAFLATRLMSNRSMRLMVYFFAALYPLFLLAESVRLPAPLFRPALTVAALGGLFLFALLLRREQRAAHHDRGARTTLSLGVLVWLVILFAEVAGYYLLARWVLHATIATAYVAFVVVFVLVLARGAMGTLTRTEFGEHLGVIRAVGVPLAWKLLGLLQVVVVVAALLQVLDVWELALSPVETWQRITQAGFRIGEVEITLGRILTAGLLVYLAVLASWVTRTVARTEIYPRWEFERGVGDSVSSLLHYFLITFGILLGLGALGVQLQNFAIVAGALGVGIGFGLQNIVNNFVSGLILLFERPVRAGDTVVIGNELGTIQKIGLRSTTVMTFDQSEVIVPNADLVSEKVTNWTLSNPVARLILPVGVAYGTDVARVLELLRQAAESHPDVLKEPAPMVLFMEFGDSSLHFELRVWVQELRLRLSVRSALLTEIARLFKEHDIEIPFPQRDLHLRSVDPRVLDATRPRPELPPDAADAS